MRTDPVGETCPVTEPDRPAAPWPVAAARLAAAITSAPWALLLGLLWLVGFVLVPLAGLGIPVLDGVARLTRAFADQARGAASAVLGEPVDRTYLGPPGPGWRTVLANVRDRRTVLDGLWLAVHGVGGVLVLAVGYALFWVSDVLLAGGTGPFDVFLLVPLLFVAVAGLLVRSLLNGFALLARALLGGADAALAARVEQLTRSRAATVDASATELRRIERDLHDGAQARLAAVGMTLGLAATFVRSDPERAEALLAEARADAGKALAELRDLVRGIHPPVLADRGLAGGLEAAALLCPIPVDVDIELAGRAQAPVESAMYFATTEAIANIGKHAQAGHARITVRHADGMLRVTVVDDGVGGVDATAGTGVRGIERRLAAFDGRLTVLSPPGGPTELTMELPCLLIPNPASGSSSPRITSSSATA